MSRYLVTGGAGFIGSHLVEGLVRQGHAVRVIDDLSTGNRTNLAPVADRIEFIEASICDSQAMGQALMGVDCVFHQAAIASVPRSVERPHDTHVACATGTLTVLDQSRRAGVRRVVFAGSSSAYGNSSWASKRESDMPSPLSPYAAAKLAAEMYCQSFFQTYGLETICLRYFNVFGPRQDPAGAYAAVIPRFITHMLAGERPVIFGDGSQSRDFTYIDNIVRANMLAASASPSAAGKVFNVATGRSFSLLHLVATLNRILNRNLEPDFQPARLGDVRDSLADISLAEKELGYQTLVSFEDGLRNTAEFYRMAGT